MDLADELGMWYPDTAFHHPMKAMGLTHSPDRLRARQRRFVDEYLTDLNGTRAAIAAGYTKNAAAQAAWELLRNPKIATEVSRRQQLRAERLEITADNVISELGKLAFANIGDFYLVDKGGRLELDTEALADPVKAAAICQIEITESADGKQITKIKLADKRAALGDLSKHLGLLTDRSEVTVTVEQAEPADTCQLALAVLALLSEAQYQGEATPTLALDGPVKVLEQGDEVRPEEAQDEFDLDN